MVKKSLSFMVLLITLLVAGCSHPFDEEEFNYIEYYSAEIIPAAQTACNDFSAWLNSSSKDGLLLTELKKNAEFIKEINLRYWTNEFPDDKVIEKWRVRRTLNGHEWVIKGRELADALYFVAANTDSFAYQLELLFENQGSLSDEQLESLIACSKDMKVQLEWLKRLLFTGNEVGID
jgi:hypothetical protein